MSDFFNGGWGIYIAIVTGVGIVWCLYLLFSQRKTNVTYGSHSAKPMLPMRQMVLWQILATCGTVIYVS
ncbi:MAG: hypothetical protein RL615_504 [Pseudomonadota bacterium]